MFSDIEGSTRLLEARPAEYAGILERHRAIVRSAIAAHGGVEVDTQGDSFFVAFPGAANAIGAAIEVQRGIGTEPWPSGADVRVRIGLHTGEGRRGGGGGYVGLDVHRAARVMAAAHGGQVLVSDATRSLVVRDLDERVRP